MIKPKINTMLPKTNYEFEKGETIEEKVRRITENNEPITDGAPIIYTPKDKGVIDAYNIRADKWDIAQEAMDKVNASKIAKSKKYMTIDGLEKKGDNDQTTTGTTTTEGQSGTVA